MGSNVFSLGSDSLESRIQAFPKTETHLHIEGALPYELLHELDPDKFPSEPFFRAPGYRYSNFVEFETLLIDHAVVWYTGPERYHEACKRIFAGLVDQNVSYLETSLHLPMIEFIGADGHELIDAIKSAAPEGLDVKVIGGLTRDSYSEVMGSVIEDLHKWDDLDGIDLHGQEWLKMEGWAPALWQRCGESGKILKAHAGEFGGPENVSEVLDKLGATRVQHGVRAIEDDDLVKRLSDQGVILDMSPISNEKLKVVPDLESHPIRSFFDAGVICTINTDDPLCFSNTLNDEYLALSKRLGFSNEDLAEIAKNGFRHARMDEGLKRKRMAEIDSLLID